MLLFFLKIFTTVLVFAVIVFIACAFETDRY